METSVCLCCAFSVDTFLPLVKIYCNKMRFCLIIAILLWASVTKTVSPASLSTLQGPIQGRSPTSTLPEDCLSTIDLQDIVFISAVPVAAGFGLLLLLSFLCDLRQACKSKRCLSSSPRNVQGNGARKHHAYVLDVDYAGRSRWGAFLRWCAMHKSPGANQNPRLVRLQGTHGFSDWLSFDLILGGKSEQKTLAASPSIGQLVAVETTYPSAGDGLHSRPLATSNLGACLRGIINRACDIEINNIHVTDTKTRHHYISGCGPSSGGLSSSDEGITTILPLLLTTPQPVARVSYAAYYFKRGSLWTSAFTPWCQGNFTGSRHITCLFACVSYTMVAVQLVSEPVLQPHLGEFVVANPLDVDITVAMLIKAAGLSALLCPFLIMMEVLGRTSPTILLSCGPSATVTLEHSGSLSAAAASVSSPPIVQSAPGSFDDSSSQGSLPDGSPEKSASGLDMQRRGARPVEGHDTQWTRHTPPCSDSVDIPSVTSSQDEAERQVRRLTPVDFTNDNNNNETTIVEIPCDQPSTCLSASTNSDAVVDMPTSQASSNSTITPTGSDTAISLGESAISNQDKSPLNLKMSETTNKCCPRHCLAILAALAHILLIASCVFATLWSVSSFHGVCWKAFWEWVATSIISVLIQAVILDTIKAIVVTVTKRRGDKRATTPHTLIH